MMSLKRIVVGGLVGSILVGSSLMALGQESLKERLKKERDSIKDDLAIKGFSKQKGGSYLKQVEIFLLDNDKKLQTTDAQFEAIYNKTKELAEKFVEGTEKIRELEGEEWKKEFEKLMRELAQGVNDWVRLPLSDAQYKEYQKLVDKKVEKQIQAIVDYWTDALETVLDLTEEQVKSLDKWIREYTTSKMDGKGPTTPFTLVGFSHTEKFKERLLAIFNPVQMQKYEKYMQKLEEKPKKF